MRVKVTYTTECPDWWRTQIRLRLGRQGLATREECAAWLYEHGASMDENLRMEWDAWQNEAAKGEEV